ncbi:radical SAM protein [Alloprevotella sp. OH1205_COT-284]|uniref:radical SAM protein n=1 Tax=Alloprevotella sp. OH1205_COT-284 TaxID=2491043 RepID=UPI000F5FE9E2|nr:radical SAM protein [Alloprevotella sp. OH1205_COT-284]RRD79861.1 radical SAM protein [Alloprevotella sp. OH1205_COT-284]
MKLLHFTGQVWRPPYEANSQLLQVTAGCTHNKCKFCSLYYGTKFRLSPITEIEEDLKVIQSYQSKARRVFLTGGNPFVLSYNRLLDLGLLIRKYLRYCESIGMFARISDIKSKTIEELKNLRHLGFDSISIGTESGDDETLAVMNKGYTANDIVEQCKKLEEANIRYNFVYLTGLAGKDKGEQNAINTANVFNQLHPFTINFVSLTVFPESDLYIEIQRGNFIEATEHERLLELRTFISKLCIETTLLGNTVSNTVPFIGMIPNDKTRLLNELDLAIKNIGEEELRRYRDSIKSL